MGDKAKLKVRLALNLHGITSVESVQQIDEEEYEETVKKQPAAPVSSNATRAILLQDCLCAAFCTVQQTLCSARVL